MRVRLTKNIKLGLLLKENLRRFHNAVEVRQIERQEDQLSCLNALVVRVYLFDGRVRFCFTPSCQVNFGTMTSQLLSCGISNS